MIPIFRAKLNIGYSYVEGDLIKLIDKDDYVIYIKDNPNPHFIKLDTLSIGFPNIKDSQGNIIFFSLKEDGIGGDIVELIPALKNWYNIYW